MGVFLADTWPRSDNLKSCGLFSSYKVLKMMFYNLSEMNCIINFLLITLKNVDKTFLVKN